MTDFDFEQTVSGRRLENTVNRPDAASSQVGIDGGQIFAQSTAQPQQQQRGSQLQTPQWGQWVQNPQTSVNESSGRYAATSRQQQQLIAQSRSNEVIGNEPNMAILAHDDTAFSFDVFGGEHDHAYPFLDTDYLGPIYGGGGMDY